MDSGDEGAISETQVAALMGLPAPRSCRIVEFEKAEVDTRLGLLSPRYVLVVSGTKPVSMKIELVPLIYEQQPDYWGIEVVGSLPGGIVLPAFGPYTASLPLAGITGTDGIEVIGANRTERLAVPPRPLSSLSLSITSKAGELLAAVTLACMPDGGSHPSALSACMQLLEADGRIEAIPEKEGVCPEVIDPVVFSARGTWNGEERRYEQEFENRCVGVHATGGVVFDFEGPVVQPE
jgi:hypothetical protein